MSEEATVRDYPDEVRILGVGGREFILVGTAHISQESVDLVREVIEKERPDCVCVELDERRYEALSQEQTFEAKDLRDLCRAAVERTHTAPSWE